LKGVSSTAGLIAGSGTFYCHSPQPIQTALEIMRREKKYSVWSDSENASGQSEEFMTLHASVHAYSYLSQE